MTNIMDAFPSKYVQASDLQGREATIQISHVEFDQMRDGQTKPIVFFHGKKKGMVLNKTNSKTIAMIYGTDYNKWQGAELVLYTIDTEFEGQPTKGLRVKAPIRPASMPPASDFQAPMQQTAQPPAQQAPVGPDDFGQAPPAFNGPPSNVQAPSLGEISRDLGAELDDEVPF